MHGKTHIRSCSDIQRPPVRSYPNPKSLLDADDKTLSVTILALILNPGNAREH